MPFYAGQSCSLVRGILPAGDIVRRIAAEACEVIGQRLGAARALDRGRLLESAHSGRREAFFINWASALV
jgi:hypothetical protein